MTGLLLIVGVALVFDYINGFHDAANSVATIVSTRVLSPKAAVVWAASFNFVAFLVFDTHVAGSIAKGVDPGVVSIGLVATGLMGAIVWDLMTWWWALPTSSSHALLGGIAGAALVKAGPSALDMAFFGKTALFILIAPLLGSALGYGLMKAVMMLNGHRPIRVVDTAFRRAQLASAALYSLGHGGNDAQRPWALSSPHWSPAGSSPVPLRANHSRCRSGWSSPATPPWASAR